MELFKGEDFFRLTNEITESIKFKIENHNRLELLNTDYNKLVQYFIGYFKIENIVLDDKNIISSYDEKKVRHKSQFGNIPGFPEYYLEDELEFEYKIPILQGEGMLRYKPNPAIMDRFNFDIIRNNNNVASQLVVRFSIPIKDLQKQEDPQVLIEREYRNETNNLFKMIGYLNENINQLNSSLPSIIGNTLSKTVSEVKDKNSLFDKISIPIKTKLQGDKLNGKIPIKINKVIPEKPAVNSKESQYELSEEAYHQIIKSVRNYLDQTENTPASFQKLSDEELIRDQIIAHLSATFDIQVTGETFRKNGKTDICLSPGTKAAFIAECKIWKGEKYLYEGIEQLYKYSTWKDQKVAIILFNLNNINYIDLLKNLDTAIKKHPKFMKMNFTDKNIWECEFESIYSANEKMIITFTVSNYN